MTIIEQNQHYRQYSVSHTGSQSARSGLEF